MRTDTVVAEQLEEGLEQLRRLVTDFKRGYRHHKSTDYKEEDVRTEFINPFFQSLGWDVDNKAFRLPVAYKDVVQEERIRVFDGETLKAPDYTFRLGGKRAFYLDAKHPGVKLDTHKDSAFQIRRYGWTSTMPIAVLSDFEELAIYDTRFQPKHGDPAHTGRLASLPYLTFEDYEAHFESLWNLLSRPAVKDGSLERLRRDAKSLHGTKAVDAVFLDDLESWRILLARNIVQRGARISTGELNDLVLLLLNRIMFLRIAEDRGFEQYGSLARLRTHTGIWEKLQGLFRRSDARYNSGLFGENWAELTGRVKTIDDDVFRTIFAQLYTPHSSFTYDVIPQDILGRAYERLISETVTVNGRDVDIEEKPEVKKAGGVFYTPTPIVEHIVQKTLVPALEEKTLATIEGFRALDPACGSGTFLLEAYQRLLDWYLTQYESQRVQALRAGKIREIAGGDIRLTIAERQRILTEHIVGVDIDPQAVEATKFTLLLKVLEDEDDESVTAHTIGRGARGKKLQALPSIDENILSGNSLVGVDFAQQLPEFDNAQREKVRPFDLRPLFGTVDALIGNPPYVRQEQLTLIKPYLKAKYRDVYAGMADLYVYFIRHGLDFLKPGGRFGFIVANKWMRAAYGKPLRRWLATQCIEEIDDYGDLPVFETATTYPCLLFLRIGVKREKVTVANVTTLDWTKSQEELIAPERFQLSQAALREDGWTLAEPKVHMLLEKIRSAGVPLGDYVDGKIYRGVLTGLNKAFVIDEATKDRLIRADSKSAELIKPFLAGKDIKRYATPTVKRWLLFTRRGVDIDRYPAIKAHLRAYQKQLEPRPTTWDEKRDGEWEGRKPGNYMWYEIQDSVDYYQAFEGEKIIYPNICKRPEFSVSKPGAYSNQKTFIIGKSDPYLVGVLNSAIAAFFLELTIPKLRGGFYEPGYVFMKDFPVPAKADVASASSTQGIQKAVTDLLVLKQQLARAASPHDRLRIAHHIEALEMQINVEVYRLYGLTHEEIRIVERQMARPSTPNTVMGAKGLSSRKKTIKYAA